MRNPILWRIAIIAGLVILLEVLCLTGVIDKLTMQPPHRIVVDLVLMLAAGTLNAAIAKTLGNAFIAFIIAMALGVASAIVIHRLRRVRDTLEPLFATYYAIPVFAFYPMLIILFGLGDAPQIFIGAMLGVVAVIVNTLNGLDRVPNVLLKTARINHMGPVETALRVTLPCASPYVLTGAKLAVAYSLIGIIGAEFIMSNGGMGYEISFAYNNFDNAVMYPLILLILIVSISINMVIARWEKALMARRGLR
ncbi:ABC transporter permease subunit [Starkeya sp. ORNL1]|uniref:ABC transporter permease n=1 Tax=Starkeya sp. ORNL1 TaxID=2709380 RepID=UPI0014637DEC|nr:ABC transporter permease subunit [Starkeya sp. ORNL1]QJP16099.1 ABC transporter permease subunit [Starkeya sp. ORNL1]